MFIRETAYVYHLCHVGLYSKRPLNDVRALYVVEVRRGLYNSTVRNAQVTLQHALSSTSNCVGHRITLNVGLPCLQNIGIEHITNISNRCHF